MRFSFFHCLGTASGFLTDVECDEVSESCVGKSPNTSPYGSLLVGQNKNLNEYKVQGMRKGS